MGLNPFESSENVSGVQKQNIAWLKAQTELMVAQRKYMEEVNKTKKEDWEAMTASMDSLGRFAKAGGINQIFGGSIARFRNNLTLGMEGALAPITNEFVGMANDILEKLEPVFQMIGDGLNGLISGLENIDIGGGQSLWDGLMASLSGIFGLTMWAFDWLQAIEQELAQANLASNTTEGGLIYNETYFGGGDSFYDPYIEGRLQRAFW